ncbi:MAG TPA: hypothetical protein VGK58_06730 [Lacipirellulaceae bacterium]
MKSSLTKMLALTAIAATALSAGSASAFGGGFKVSFGGGHGRGHVSIGHHGHHHHGHHHHKHHYHAHVRKVYVKPVYVAPVAPCIYPLHSFCFVYPGDTWTLLSLREYGKPNFGATIAAFNGMSTSLRLAVGQQLRLPVIHPNGSLTPSSAPAPAPFVLPSQPIIAGAFPVQGLAPQQGQPVQLQGQPIANQGLPFNPQSQMSAPTGQPMPQVMQMNANGGSIGPQVPSSGPVTGPMSTPNARPSVPASPSANIRVASEERPLATVAIGSVLSLDGQALGGERGIVRLRVNGLALPVEVLEWSEESAKIRLPELDLEGPMKAEIEVLRADGSLASKTAIELTSAATRLALGN